MYSYLQSKLSFWNNITTSSVRILVSETKFRCLCFEKLERIFMFHSIFQRQTTYRKKYFEKLRNSMFFRNVGGGRNELGEKFEELTTYFTSEPNESTSQFLDSRYDVGLSYNRENEIIDKEQENIVEFPSVTPYLNHGYVETVNEDSIKLPTLIESQYGTEKIMEPTIHSSFAGELMVTSYGLNRVVNQRYRRSMFFAEIVENVEDAKSLFTENVEILYQTMLKTNVSYRDARDFDNVTCPSPLFFKDYWTTIIGKEPYSDLLGKEEAKRLGLYKEKEEEEEEEDWE